MSVSVENEEFRELIRNWPAYAIQVLYRDYYSQLLRIAQRKTNDRKEAEDIVQEAFLEVWKKSAWLAEQKGLLIGAYLVGIVRHKAISNYHQKTREWNQATGLDSTDSYQVWLTLTSQESIRATLKDRVEALPERERECIRMKYFHDMSNEAIARELGVSKKTIEKYITRALKSLRNHTREE